MATLKPHWIAQLEQIADAGKGGVLAADLDKRAASALARRDLVHAGEKLQYRGLGKAPIKVSAYFLTDAGRDWLVEYRENPTTSRALPAGWIKKEAGRYQHTASGVEVRRDGADWGVLIPMLFPGRGNLISAVASCNSRADALAVAAEHIPTVLAVIEDAWDEALFDRIGRPETWPIGQVAAEVVHDRHDAVRSSWPRTRNGFDARPGERVVDIETGERGTYQHGNEAGDSTCSYVIFDGDSAEHLVYSADVVVLPRPARDAKPGDLVRHVNTGEVGIFHGIRTYDKPFHGRTGDLAAVTFHAAPVQAPQPADPDQFVIIDQADDAEPIPEPRAVADFTVTREPKYADYTELGGPDEPGEDYYLFVDGKRIGGTYWGSAGDIPDGQRWASYGPAGYSLRNPTREAAEQVQIRAYAANPDLTDRYIADEEREAAARRAQAEEEERQAAEAERIEREGDDEPGEPIWVLPPWHVLIGDLDATHTVSEWLAEHDLHRVDAGHEIRVERRAARQAIVVQEFPLGFRTGQTHTRVVTCRQQPPAVDLTARPDLVKLIDGGHIPARFPLIDFGQNLACSKCTGESGDATKVVCWPCPTFEKTRTVGAAEIVWKQAESAVIAAEASLRVAALRDRDITPEENMVRAAEIHYERARIALSAARRDPELHADVRFIMVTRSDDDGSTWTPIHWLGFTRLAGETAAAQALRYAGHHHLVPGDSWYLDENPAAYRVEVYSDSMADEPDGVWTNLTDPCRPGRHNAGRNPIDGAPARADGSNVETTFCGRCFHRVWRVVPAAGRPGRWKPIGQPLPGPDNHSDPDPHPDSDQATDFKVVKAGSGPGPNAGPAAFGFRVETRTGRRWATVRMGNTPPLYRPDPEGLWVAADSILGNARSVLGLGPKARMPGVRVRTWHVQSGATHLLARTADRKGNSGVF